MRAFSLFTPLVGTAMVMITIVMATIMIQNDVRIARGLSQTYAITAQSLSARLIKAAGEAGLIAAIEQNVRRTIDAITIDCSDESECKSEFERLFISSGAAKPFLVSQIEQLRTYSTMLDAIEVATDYVPDEEEKNGMPERISNFLQGAEFISSGWDKNDLVIRVNSGGFSDEAFSLGFTKEDEHIRVVFKPIEIKVRIANFKIYLENAIRNWAADVRNKKCSDPPKGMGKRIECSEGDGTSTYRVPGGIRLHFKATVGADISCQKEGVEHVH